MNEDRKKRGLAHSKFLTVVAMNALFLSSGNVMATQVASDNVLEVTEQLQSINVTGLVVDATGDRKSTRLNSSHPSSSRMPSSA